MGRNKELALNSVYFMIGNLGAKVVSFVMVPLYTIWLVPAEYGVVDLINTYNQILILLVGLGIADALVVFPINKETDEIEKQFSTAVIFHTLFCVIFFFVFLFLYFAKLEWLSSINPVIWYAYALLITSTTMRLIQSFCRGIKKMKVFSYTGIIHALSTALLSILLVPSNGLYGYLIALVLSNVVTLLFVLLYSKANKYFNIHGYSRDTLKEMLKYSIPLIPNSLMWWLILGMNRPLLEQYHGIAAVGLLAVANKIPMLVDMFYGFFHQSWIVTIVSEYGKKGFDSYYNSIFSAVVAFQSFACIAIMGFGKILFDIFIDAKYAEAWIYVPFMCLTVVISNISTFSTSIFNAVMKTKYLFYSVIYAAIAAVLLNYLLIPSYGIWGALVAMMLAHAISAISRIIYGWRFIKIQNIAWILLNISVCVVALFVVKIDNPYLMYSLLLIVLAIFGLLNKKYVTYIKSLLKKKKA